MKRDQIQILLVEDDIQMKDSLTVLLRSEGFQVIAVGKSLEALSAMIVELRQGRTIDLFIATHLSNGDCTSELIAAVRKAWPDLPALLVSDQRHEGQWIKNIGFDKLYIIYKPFGPIDFLKGIALALGGYKKAPSPDRQNSTIAIRRLDQ